jgi:hypothetical protein
MPPFPRVQIAQLLQTASNGATAQMRGAALEEAACAMFSPIPGILAPARNIVDYAGAGEIDILFPNKSPLDGLWFMPRAFLCECKNWNSAVGSQEVVVFTNRIKQRACAFGVLISTNGITGSPEDLTAANHHIARALENGIEIIVLDWQNLTQITSTKGLIKCIEQKWIRLKSFLTSA